MDNRTCVVSVAALVVGSTAVCGTDLGVSDYRVVDAVIPAPLTGATPDPGRGREIVLDMRRGNCLACHSVPNE
ncbi:MAG: hypothetical protein GY933_08740, partial [Hyphomicrobiales bacterium]|nr:hypothetical protein [Hyphomicrobiales bacterium]